MPDPHTVCQRCSHTETRDVLPGSLELAKVQRLARLWAQAGGVEAAVMMNERVLGQLRSLRGAMRSSHHPGHIARYQASALVLKASHAALQAAAGESPLEETGHVMMPRHRATWRGLREEAREATEAMLEAAQLGAGEGDPMQIPILELLRELGGGGGAAEACLSGA